MLLRLHLHQCLSVWWPQSHSKQGTGISLPRWRRLFWQPLHQRPTQMLCAPAAAMTGASEQDHPSLFSMLVSIQSCVS